MTTGGEAPYSKNSHKVRGLYLYTLKRLAADVAQEGAQAQYRN